MNKFLLGGMGALLVGSAALSNITTITQNSKKNNIYQAMEDYDISDINTDINSPEFWEDIKIMAREQVEIAITQGIEEEEGFLGSRSKREVENYTFDISDDFIDEMQITDFNEDLGMLSFYDLIVDESQKYTEEIQEVFDEEIGGWIGDLTGLNSQVTNPDSRIFCIDPETSHNWCTEEKEPEIQIPDGYTKKDVEETLKFDKMIRDINFANAIIIPFAIGAAAASIALWAMAWFFGFSVPAAIACSVLAAALSVTSAALTVATLPHGQINYRPVDVYYLAAAVADFTLAIADIILLIVGGLTVTVAATEWAFPVIFLALGAIGMLVTYCDLFGQIK
ncbi:hypothetical protein [Spiroplasma endosymbiont of Panorpa germanica]|uniref:hypothetical protein n=1 Tax=Spiroplasma endosymbiont of Panorpa germanica TaxID=3066314 RepID=UPI0030CBEFB3